MVGFQALSLIFFHFKYLFQLSERVDDCVQYFKLDYVEYHFEHCINIPLLSKIN